MIVAHVYAPGSILPVEDDLAARLAVGRNVVREAIKILQDKRLLRTERRSGTVVLPVADWDYLDIEVIGWTIGNAQARDLIVDELNDLRAIIEPEAAAMGARLATASEVLRLFEALERMERAATDIDIVQADILFHERLFLASHNRLLFSLVRAVGAVLKANLELAIQIRHDIPQFLAGNICHLGQMRALRTEATLLHGPGR